MVNSGLGRREYSFGKWNQCIPPNPKVKSGTNLVVQVVEVDSASNFSVTTDPSSIGVDHHTLATRTKLAPKLPITTPLMPQMLCLVVLNIDGPTYLRAEILAVTDQGVQVRLLDFGKHCIVPTNSLYAMPLELLSFPPLSLQLCLAGLENTHDGQSDTQLVWLRELAHRREPINITILHAMSANHYSVVVQEVGIINLSPLPYRMLPLLGQRPFNIYLKRSLSPTSFTDPITPAILSSALSSYDTLVAAFLAHLSLEKLQNLPTSAIRSSVFCIAFDTFADDVAKYPLRCVISSPILGSEMRALVYEIDTGRQSIRSIDQLFCAPSWTYDLPALCVPVIAFDNEGRPACPRAVASQVRAIQREYVASPAGVVVVQEIASKTLNYDNNRILHPVIEEVSFEISYFRKRCLINLNCNR